jgi:hypothetical protein
MRLSSMIRRFRRREDGTVTVEFVILVPLIFAIFIATLEIGMMMSRWSGLDRAADMVIRSLRLGQYQNPTALTRDQNIIQPVTQVTPGQQNDLMLIRVCIAVDALFPTSRFALPITLDAQGGYALSVASVYVNEPS